MTKKVVIDSEELELKTWMEVCLMEDSELAEMYGALFRIMPKEEEVITKELYDTEGNAWVIQVMGNVKQIRPGMGCLIKSIGSSKEVKEETEEEAAIKYASGYMTVHERLYAKEDFLAGIQWQKEREKNKECDCNFCRELRGEK